MTDALVRLDEAYTFCVERLSDDERRYYSDTHWVRFTADAHFGA
ncbi:hypothetical protein [Streptomyces sp. NPDC002403]